MNSEPKIRNLELVLYSGPNCPLCEKAKQVVWPVLSNTGYRLQEVDITSNVELLRRYRLRIPVVKREEGNELSWPFDTDQFESWLAGDKSGT